MGTLALTKKVKKMALELGADLIGIANVERLEGQPKGISARDYLDGVRSVIALGVHFPYSVISAWKTSPFAYMYYGYIVPNMYIGRIAFSISKFLEKEGYQTYPVVPTIYFKDLDFGKNMRGEFCHRHAAFVAGLGEFGLSGNFMTPEYGPNQRLGSILTQAELEPDPLYNGPALCDKCMKCVTACPTGALKKEKIIKHVVARKEVPYFDIDKLACLSSILGYPPGSGGFLNIELPKKDKWKFRDFIEYRRKAREHPLFKTQHIIQTAMGWADFCGRCTHVCDRPEGRLYAPKDPKGGV